MMSQDQTAFYKLHRTGILGAGGRGGVEGGMAVIVISALKLWEL